MWLLHNQGALMSYSVQVLCSFDFVTISPPSHPRLSVNLFFILLTILPQILLKRFKYFNRDIFLFLLLVLVEPYIKFVCNFLRRVMFVSSFEKPNVTAE